ncbi:MAG: hypothetical protein IH945_05860 [Armatimonadetes bacterium]|nr:hypothetical protein [Armatimonadota bacterium]
MRQEQEELEQRRGWIKKGLEQLSRQIESRRAKEDWQLLAAQYAEALHAASQSRELRPRSNKLFNRSPAERMTADVLLAFSVDELLSVSPGTRQTYSDRKTPVLKRYPAEAGRIFGRYRTNLLAWREALRATTQNVPLFGVLDRRKRLVKSRGAPTSLAINILSSDTSLALHCWLFNEFGEAVGGGDHSLSGAPYESPANLHLRGKTSIPMPAVYASYLVINQRPPGMGRAELERWQNHFRQKALNIADNDPIAAAVGPMLIDMANQNDRQLVALVPDEAWQWTRGARTNQREYAPSQFASLVARDWAMTASDEDGWVLASPSRPASARKSYLHRRPLQTFARAVDEHGYVRILDAIAYVSDQPSDDPFSSETTVIGHVIKSSGMLRPTQPIESGGIELIRILAAAGPMLRVGSDLHVEPGSKLGRQIAHWIFRSPADFFGWSYAGEADPQNPVASYHHKRSLALPGGVPPGTVMRLTVEEEKATFFRPSPGSLNLRPEGADDRYVGGYVSRWEKQAEFNAVQFTTVSKLTVEITFPGGYKLTTSLTEVPAPSEQAWRTMAQLTKTERANLERLKNEYLERMGR